MTEDLGTDFTWQAHPARERIGATVLALGLIGAIAGAVWLSFQSPIWAAVALLVLLVSVANR